MIRIVEKLAVHDASREGIPALTTIAVRVFYPREVEVVYENVAGKFDVFCRISEEPGLANNGSLTRQ
jgi:hypothetical protein